MEVYLSYVHDDEPTARRIAESLAAAGLRVWDHEREILPGDNWAAEVERALTRADAMVVVVTAASLRSTWVRRELEYALGETRFQGRLVPVIIGSPEEVPDKAVPWILHRLKAIRITRHADEKPALNEIAAFLSAAMSTDVICEARA
ncbi:MAG: toll/interleukin-1 receptor domain-containing protein [bacterium]|nr:toll/interleukin-1 receptor domain-containing protein [bacterium]